MKKYTLLLLIVLGVSTTAWGSFACVTVPPCTPCADDVCIGVTACLPYNCSGEPIVEYCVYGNMVLVDILYTCEDCACGGRTAVDTGVCVPLCPGVYSVLARVSVECESGCWATGPRVSAIGSAFFKVCCDNPCPSPWCLPQYPCGGCPTGGCPTDGGDQQ
jgi:hypothetical protein